MGKVKKSGAVRKSRTKPSAKAKKAPPKAKRVTSGARTQSARNTAERVGKRRIVAKSAPPPVASFLVRELDPHTKCGPGTSVQRLFRIDEKTSDGVVRPHLVFFDRHGWYCEHGRSCPAVTDVRKLGKHTGLNYNGRMRA